MHVTFSSTHLPFERHRVCTCTSPSLAHTFRSNVILCAHMSSFNTHLPFERHLVCTCTSPFCTRLPTFQVYEFERVTCLEMPVGSFLACSTAHWLALATSNFGFGNPMMRPEVCFPPWSCSVTRLVYSSHPTFFEGLFHTCPM
jgi:hypothetical protein